MSDEYTPNTDNVRLHYARPQEPTPPEVQEARAAEFDRWLSEYRASALGEVLAVLDAPDPDETDHDESVYLEWANDRLDKVREAITTSATEATR